MSGESIASSLGICLSGDGWRKINLQGSALEMAKAEESQRTSYLSIAS